MQRRAHPFFSRLGCGAALFLALGLAAVVYARGGAPFSPGPLAAAGEQGVAPLAAGVTPAAQRDESPFASHAEFEDDCGACHAPWHGISAAQCETCHTNVAEQRRGTAGLHGLLGDTGRCQECHTDHHGRTASLTQVSTDIFDHAQTAFSLVRHETDYEGAPMACAECHMTGDFTRANVDCLSCHTAAEPSFMTEHTALFGQDCLACHDGLDGMADFEHATVFVLDGAHATVACASCHAAQQFQGTPRECAGCHEEPAVHAGLFGLDCVRCHTTSAWTPAELTAHIFPLDHGEEGPQACAVCHDQTYTTYTCYNCHEHDPAEIREEHLDEGFRDFEDCVECHATGQKEEGERD